MPKSVSGHSLLNGTEFDYVVSSAPRAYANPRKLHQQNKMEYVVRRVVVVQFKVKAKHKSPEGITFVPLFLTNEDIFLEPSTCEPVGHLENDRVQLHAGFVDKVETRDVKLKGKRISFEMEDEINLLEDIDLPPPVASSSFVHPSMGRKFAAKTFPPFFGAKRPRDGELSDEDCNSEDCEEQEGTGTDLDSDNDEGVEVLRRPLGVKKPRLV